MKFKKKTRPVIKPSAQLGDRLGLNVIPKNKETKDFLFKAREGRAYQKHGCIWRRQPDGKLVCLGEVHKAWKELGL